jgi:hypothetical protein
MFRLVLISLVLSLFLTACPGRDDDDNENSVNNVTTGDTVSMLQDPANSKFLDDGDAVDLKDVVVTAIDNYGDFTGNFWVSDPDGGAYSGVVVYNYDTTSQWFIDLKVGDIVNVSGVKDEYSYEDPQTGEAQFEDRLTEVVESLVSIRGSGTPVTPTVIPGSDLLSVATGEQWEGVLVTINNVRVSEVGERSGRFEVSLGGSTKAQDDIYDITSTTEGVCLSKLTGVVSYFFDYYLVPRDAGDIEFAANDGDCAEIVDEICDDGIDNDGNSFIDCLDFACSADPNCVAGPENTDALCADSEDNDEDGLVDCADPSCSNHPDVTVCKELNCTDGIDNDGDGYEDCADFDCNEEATCIESDCTDGNDNDGDGYTDCEDNDCKLDATCAGDYEIDCEDGLDDDGDTYIDCADFDCADNPICTETNCTDGVDNNGNGYTDCEDNDCLYTDASCAVDNEVSDADCSDGIDNDGDGYTDCDDFSCKQNPFTTVCDGSIITCADGLDNGGNGFIDCADFACRSCGGSYTFSVATCPPCEE